MASTVEYLWVLVIGSRLTYFIPLRSAWDWTHTVTSLVESHESTKCLPKKRVKANHRQKPFARQKSCLVLFFPHILNDTGLFIQGHWWYCLHIVCMFCRFVSHHVSLIFDAAMSAYFMHFNWLGLVHLNHLVMHLNILPFAEVAHDYEMGKPLGFSFTRLCSLERCAQGSKKPPEKQRAKVFPLKIGRNKRPKRKGKLSSKHQCSKLVSGECIKWDPI